jgi:hypothetical protein
VPLYEYTLNIYGFGHFAREWYSATHYKALKCKCVHLLNLRLRKLGKRIGGCDRRDQLWRRAPVVNTCTPTPTETPTVKLAPKYPQPPAIIPSHIHTWWHYWKGGCVPLRHLVHESSSRISEETGQERMCEEGAGETYSLCGTGMS